jgi:hypothetical protein
VHACLEGISELVFRARLYKWAVSQLGGDEHDRLREKLHDPLCTLSLPSQCEYAAQMRHLGVDTRWEDVVSSVLRSSA